MLIVGLSDAWLATLGLVGIFFVMFPLLVQGLLVYIGVQVAGERRQNLEHRRARGRADSE